MKNKIGKVFFSAILLILFWLALSPIANAQTPTPPTRESITKEIQLRAQSDIDNGKSMESTEGLNALFGEQAKQAGMSLSEVVSIYEQEYKIAKTAKPWWEGWLPNLGWVAAFIALLGVIFKGAIEEAGKKFVTTIGAAIYNRIARYRPFWMFALRKYRQSLENTYRELKIPFRAGRPLEMKDVYVPVRVDGGDKKQVDAYQTIQNQKRLVVLGDPGSGKTMFLRHVAFTYARQGLDDFDGQPIPVYLELNRVESAGGDLLTALTKTLENHNFPGADGFLKSALENQSLLILLDGLDEVNAAARPTLVKQIQDLDQKHAGNRIIVTCRKAVYQGELDAWVDGKLEIVEFSDQQIQRFMTSWQKDMPAEKSIEHFFRTLQERPQIMALARNPLLLTMVAYLYVDTEFALPHSRSEFYSRSTDLLLDQWKLERNRYKATHKRIVLQRLALFNQSQAGKTGERRTMELADVLKETRDVLPDLTLKTEDAQPLLDEIVQRSGLLLAIDGGTRYQFTHLTLQEYFAARALEADQKGLLDFYRAAPDAWREVVRLWCALEHNSTAMLKELYALDPVMAFECLSDAQQVDNAYADELIESFKPRLHEALTDDSLASAFALLAADPRPRGRKWFKFVESNLNDEDNRLAACTILARTNIPQAAEPLASMAKVKHRLRIYLIQLGNLAVPTLKVLAQNEEIWAIDALVDIGTPQAALALESMLWTDESKACHAAWRLAALLSLSGVEDALKAVALTSEQRKTKQIEWIWEPFSEDLTLRTIMGRIAYLLKVTDKNRLPPKELPCDPRLALPLATIVTSGVIRDRVLRLYPKWNRVFKHKDKEIIPTMDDWRNLFKPVNYDFSTSWHVYVLKLLLLLLLPLNLLGIWNQISRSSNLFSLKNGVDVLIGVMLLVGVLFVQTQKTTWKTDGLENIVTIAFLGLGVFCGGVLIVPIHNLAVSILVGVLFCALFVSYDSGIFQSSRPMTDYLKKDFAIPFLICELVTTLIIAVIFFSDIEGGLLIITLILVLMILATWGNSKLKWINDSEDLSTNLIASTLVMLGFVLVLSLMHFSSKALYEMGGLSVTLMFWLTWLSSFYFVYLKAKRQERRAQNPLRGLLEPSPSANGVTNKRMTMGARLLRWMR